MEKKLSMFEVLSRMVARVRRIESDAVAVAGVLDKMIERSNEREAAGSEEDKRSKKGNEA